MTVAHPSVSTAGSLRIRTWRAAMRWTPTASAIVTIAGRPSGTAATARETLDIKRTSNDQPRRSPGDRHQGNNAEAHEHQRAADLGQALLKRGRALFHCREKVRDPAELGAHARRHNSGHRRAGHDGSTHEHRVTTLGERRIRWSRAAATSLPVTLAGQHGLVGGERVRLEQARVGGDDVARLEDSGGRPGRPRPRG